MKRSPIKNAFLSILLATLPLLGAGTLAAADSYSTRATCQLLAWTPGHDLAKGNAWAQGGRTGCTNTETVTVELRKNVNNAPDIAIASGKQRGTEVKFMVYGTISTSDRGKTFFTRTKSSTGAKRESARIIFN